MRPFNSPTEIFSDDQTATFNAVFYDSTCTVPETGIQIGLFDVLDSSLDLLASAFSSHSALEAVLNNSTVSTQRVRSILGYAEGAARMGLEPNLIKYWGSGAPPGCSLSRRVFLKYKGVVRCSDSASHPTTLVFGGNGKIRVFKNGTQISAGQIREPLVDALLTTSASIQREGGYLIVETNVQAGDVLEIYYCNNGESWGGILGKVIPGIGHANSWTTFRTKLRDAGVISASFLSAAVSSGVDLPYCSDALLQVGEGQTPVLELQVALAPDTEPNGYSLQHVGGQNQLVDNGDSSLVIRPARRIKFSAGFKHPDGSLELYERFTGQVTSITPNAGGDSATITCHGFEGRLQGALNENYPDRLSYIGHGFIDWEWKGFPVYPILAWDAWPLEVATAEMCYRAGIDSYNLGKSAFELAPNYGKYAYIESNPEPLPTISLEGLLTGATPSVTSTVSSNVASVKIAYSLVGFPSDATVRAATVDATSPFNASFPDLSTGQTLYVAAFAYDSSGRESLRSEVTIIGPTITTNDTIPIIWMDSFAIGDVQFSDRAWSSDGFQIAGSDDFASAWQYADHEINFISSPVGTGPSKGFAVRINLNGITITADLPIGYFIGTTGGTLGIYINSSHQIVARRTDSAADVILGTSTGTILSTGWVHIECHVTINATTGSLIVRKNTPTTTEVLLSLTGINTRSDYGNNTIEIVSIGPQWNQYYEPGDPGGIVQFKDFVVLDTTGFSPTDYIGDVSVGAALPIANAHVESNSFGSPDAWKNVSARQQRNDRYYNIFTATNQYDLYTMTQVPSTVTTVLAVSPFHWVRLSSSIPISPTTSGKTLIKSGSTTVQGSSVSLSQSRYSGFLNARDIYNQNPDTSSAWTRTSLNALQVGFQYIGGAKPILLSQLGVEYVYRGTSTLPSEGIVPTTPPIVYANCFEHAKVPVDVSYDNPGAELVVDSTRTGSSRVYFDLNPLGNIKEIGITLRIDMNSVTLLEDLKLYRFFDTNNESSLTDQIVIGINPSRQIYYKKGTSVIATSTGTLDASGYQSVEVRFRHGITDGSLRVRKNSTDLLNLTNLDTTRFSYPTEYQLQFFRLELYSSNAENGEGMKVDDLVVFLPEGFSTSTFMGDVRVAACSVTGDGALSESTPVYQFGGSSTTRYLNVVDSPDSGFSHNNFATGQRDLYTFESPPSNIIAVLPYFESVTEATNVMNLAAFLLRSGTTLSSHATIVTPLSSFNGVDIWQFNRPYVTPTNKILPMVVFENDPATGSPWASGSPPSIQAGWTQLTSGRSCDLFMTALRYVYRP